MLQAIEIYFNYNNSIIDQLFLFFLSESIPSKAHTYEYNI